MAPLSGSSQPSRHRIGNKSSTNADPSSPFVDGTSPVSGSSNVPNTKTGAHIPTAWPMAANRLPVTSHLISPHPRTSSPGPLYPPSNMSPIPHPPTWPITSDLAHLSPNASQSSPRLATNVSPSSSHALVTDEHPVRSSMRPFAPSSHMAKGSQSPAYPATNASPDLFNPLPMPHRPTWPTTSDPSYPPNMSQSPSDPATNTTSFDPLNPPTNVFPTSQTPTRPTTADPSHLLSDASQMLPHPVTNVLPGPASLAPFNASDNMHLTPPHLPSSVRPFVSSSRMASAAPSFAASFARTKDARATVKGKEKQQNTLTAGFKSDLAVAPGTYPSPQLLFHSVPFPYTHPPSGASSLASNPNAYSQAVFLPAPAPEHSYPHPPPPPTYGYYPPSAQRFYSAGSHLVNIATVAPIPGHLSEVAASPVNDLH